VSDTQRMAGNTADGDEHGTAAGDGRSELGFVTVAGSAIPQVRHPKFGITTDELVEAHRRFSNYSRYRIMSSGRQQYDRGSSQAFESMSPQRILLELRDELADVQAYLAMLDITLSRWQQAMEEIS
jgi:hypothetical protein